MPRKPLETRVDPDYSGENASATSWEQAERHLEAAEIFWLSTVRPEGRPHVTPLLAVWHDDVLHFCTGKDERKRRNLAANDQCILTTGCNRYAEGLDLVVEGRAARVTDDAVLRALAAAWEAKYGSDWHFDVNDGAFVSAGHAAWVYRVEPNPAFGFDRGGPGSQTRWRF